MSNSPPHDGQPQAQLPESRLRAQANATQMSEQMPTIPVPGMARGGGDTPGQATAAVPVVSVETDELPRRGLTPATFLCCAMAVVNRYCSGESWRWRSVGPTGSGRTRAAREGEGGGGDERGSLRYGAYGVSTPTPCLRPTG